MSRGARSGVIPESQRAAESGHAKGSVSLISSLSSASHTLIFVSIIAIVTVGLLTDVTIVPNYSISDRKRKKLMIGSRSSTYLSIHVASKIRLVPGMHKDTYPVTIPCFRMSRKVRISLTV